ncbi:MAG TPA: sensor histidine kinase [Burkholderiaceae bacterium]|nr:sensor histidine kinase [Burkholderiaceae bacterium]
MTLSEFIERELDRIVDEWAEFARTRIAAARGLSPEALRDGARALLLDVADDIESPQTGRAQREKSRGDRPDNAAPVTGKARGHASDRLAQGFTLDELVAEYRALRASVVRGWIDRRLFETVPEPLAELVRFDEAVDQALTESIAWYSAKVRESRDLLLGALDHDLRDPLGAVGNSARCLVRADGLTGPQAEAVGRIVDGTARMQRRVDDLLDFTRTRLGRGLSIEPEPADLGAVCRETVDEIEAVHPGRTLRPECDGELAGRWDVPRLKQLLSNLLANAIRHGAPATPVTVTARGEPDGVVLRVLNEGPPIAPDALPSLFEPTMRAVVREVDRREGSSGLGLGLYIARQIAVAHGGSIEVASSAADGTAFTVRLPRGAGPGDERSAGLA